MNKYNPNNLPKALSPNTITLGSKASEYKLGGGVQTQTFNPQQLATKMKQKMRQRQHVQKFLKKLNWTQQKNGKYASWISALKYHEVKHKQPLNSVSLWPSMEAMFLTLAVTL